MYNFSFNEFRDFEQKQQPQKKIDTKYNYSGNMLFKTNKMASPSMYNSAASLLSELKNALKNTSEQAPNQGHNTACDSCLAIQTANNDNLTNIKNLLGDLMDSMYQSLAYAKANVELLSKIKAHDPYYIIPIVATPIVKLEKTYCALGIIKDCSTCALLADTHEKLQSLYNNVVDEYNESYDNMSKLIELNKQYNAKVKSIKTLPLNTLKVKVVDKIVGNNYDERVEDLQLKVNELSEIIDDLKYVISGKDNVITTIDTEKVNLEKSLATLQTEVKEFAAVYEELDTLRRQKEDVETQLEIMRITAEDNNPQLQNQINIMQQELDIKKQYISDLEKKLSQAIDEHNDVYNKMKRILETKDEEIAEQANTISKLHNKIDKLEDYDAIKPKREPIVLPFDTTFVCYAIGDNNDPLYNIAVESLNHPIWVNSNKVWHVLLDKTNSLHQLILKDDVWVYTTSSFADIAKVEAENKSLWVTFDNITQERNKLEQKLDEISRSKQELETLHSKEISLIRDAFEIKLADLQDSIDYYLSEIGHLQSESKGDLMYINNLKLQLSDLQKQYEMTLAENVKLSEEIIISDNSIADLEDKLEAAEANAELLKSNTNEKVNTQLVDLETRFNDLVGEFEVLSASNQALDRKLKYADSDNQDLQAELDVAQKRITEYVNTLDTLKEEKAEHLKEIKYLKAELDNTSKSLELAIQNSERVAKLRHEETLEHKKDIANMNTNMNELYDHLEVNDKKLQAQEKKSTEIIEFLNREVNVKADEVQQLKKESKFYDEQYGELSNKHKRDKIAKAEMQAIIDNLKAEVAQLKAENKRLIDHVINPEEWDEITEDEIVSDTVAQ